MQNPLTDTTFENIAWKNTPFYNAFIDHVANQNPDYSHLVGEYLSAESLKEKIDRRPKVNRETLVKHLHKQYQRFGVEDESKHKQIDRLLNPNCFTVTTGHQICFLTGPLYVPIKIYQSINLAKHCQKLLPEKDFLPVYWMATEDHDFEEIKSAFIFNQSFEMDPADASKKVGSLSADLAAHVLSNELKETLCRNDLGQKAYNEISAAFEGATSLAHFTFNLCQRFFANEELLILDADAPELKHTAISVFEKELKEKAIHNSVHSFKPKLEPFTSLAIDPRKLNLFYFEGDIRYRLDADEKGVFNADTGARIAVSDLLAAPEKLSPNVLCRPLFQESILPNIAYVGGAAELQYWAELTETFTAFNLQQPFVVLRNSVLVLSKSDQKKLDKAHIQFQDLFLEEHHLTEKLAQNDGYNLDQSALKKAYQAYNQMLVAYCAEVDPTLGPSVKAHHAEEMNYLKDLKKDLKKRILIKNEQGLQQILNLRNQLLPKGNLNERRINIVEYLSKYGMDFLPLLKQASGARNAGLCVLQMP